MAELRRVSRAPGPPRLSAGPAVARELAVRSGPRSVGAPALHLMHSGCVSQPGAPAARSHSPSNAPARARNAHHLAGPRTHRNAQTRGAAIHPPAPRDARNVPRPAPCPSLPVVTAPGPRGRAGSSLLAFPSTTRCRAFVLPLRRGAGPPPRALARRPACPDSRLSFGSLSLSLFPNPAPLLSAVWLPGKSCFPKFAEVASKSLWGWLGLGASESKINPRSSSG